MSTYLDTLNFNNNDTDAVNRVLKSLVNKENIYKLIVLKGGSSSGKTTFFRLLKKINPSIQFENNFDLDSYYAPEHYLNSLKQRMRPNQILSPHMYPEAEQIDTGNLTPPYPISFLVNVNPDIFVIETREYIPEEILSPSAHSIVINFEHEFPSGSGFYNTFETNVEQYAEELIEKFK